MDKNTGTTNIYLHNCMDANAQHKKLTNAAQDRAELLISLLKFLEEKQDKKIDLIRYLLNNLNRECMVIMTVDELYQATKLSKPFILGVLRKLEWLGVITRRSGIVKFNQDFLSSNLLLAIQFEADHE